MSRLIRKIGILYCGLLVMVTRRLYVFLLRMMLMYLIFKTKSYRQLQFRLKIPLVDQLLHQLKSQKRDLRKRQTITRQEDTLLYTGQVTKDI
jgi:hypothetical protein